jgi:hypothetical protein
MPRKADPAQRCADLLAALARTANVRLALRETGISAFWAYGRRRADADFDRRWRSVVRAAKARLGRAVAARAGDAAAPRPGVTEGLALAGSLGKGTLRLELPGTYAFTEERRAQFLDALRATCNVMEAARASGVSKTGAYRWYHKDAAFRAGWDAALAEGRVHLELALIGAARALFEAPEEQCAVPVAPADITGMDAKAAIQLLKLHTPRDAAGRKRSRWVKPADPDETRREILAKVAAVKAARGRDEALLRAESEA